MKCSVFAFTSEYSSAYESTAFLLQKLFEINAEVDINLMAAPKIDIVLKAMQNLNKPDHVFMFCEEDALKSFRVKKAIAKHLEIGVQDSEELKNHILTLKESALLDNETISNYSKTFTQGKNILLDNTFLNAICIEKDSTVYHFLPLNLLSTKNYVEKTIEDIENKTNITTKIIKTFNLKKHEILEKINTIKEEYKEIFIEVFVEKASGLIRVSAKEFVDKQRLQNCVNTIQSVFQNYIYSNTNNSIYKEVLNKLKLRRANLSIIETITKGNILVNLNNENLGCENIIEAIYPQSLLAKKKRLNLNPETLQKYSIKSAEIAYELASGALDTYPDSIVLSTCGEINTETNCGELYLAVGNIDAIHVYKHIAKGSDLQITQEFSFAAMFYLLNYLNKNSF